MSALYFYKMNYSKANMRSASRDRFIMSKGHSVPAQYVVLSMLGIIAPEELKSLKQMGSPLQGHPDMRKTPGIEAPTGSLGMGLSFANGISMAARFDGMKFNIYLLLGDGELQEGQVWEAAMNTAHQRLTNLCVIVDRNRFQSQGSVEDLKGIEPLVDKWKAFGWDAFRIDGNDMTAVCSVLDRFDGTNEKPFAIIADTVKGKGVSFMENTFTYHNASVSVDEHQRAMAELQDRIATMNTEQGQCQMTDEKKESTRDRYGKALAELAKNDQRVIALDCDLGRSTRSFEITKVDSKRFIEMGIAEQDMISTAAGMATMGKIPFANSFAVFITGRAFDQIRQQVALPKSNVKICGSSAGITIGADGSTHQSILDVALMRTLPNLTVLVPADGNQTEHAVHAAHAYEGPVYIRLSRYETENFIPAGLPFRIGKAQVLSQGDGVVFASCGPITSNVIQAARMLERRGIKAGIVNFHTLKPIDRTAVEEMAAAYRHVISVEEHTVFGGLGTAIAECLAEYEGSGPRAVLHRIGLQDCFGESGSAEELLRKHGLHPEGIAEIAAALL